jgi:hypothetical protein
MARITRPDEKPDFANPSGTRRVQERSSPTRPFLGVVLSAMLLTAGPALPKNEEDSFQLVTDLGDSSWNRRETAERELLTKGLSVANLLEEATRSKNLELAYRAKYLLSRIDPNIIEYQILRLEIPGHQSEDPLRLTAMATAWGSEEKKLKAQLSGLDHDTPAKSSLPTFTMTGRAMRDGRIEVEVGQTRARGVTVDLGVFVAAPGTATLLTTSEESDYQRLGVHVERECTRVATILHVQRGRKSFVEKIPSPADKEARLAQLLRQLRKGTSAADLEKRKAALELLTRLRVTYPAEQLRAQLEEPATRALASLCTSDADLLAEVVAGTAPHKAPASTTVTHRIKASTRVRAAIRLLEVGDERGLEVLLRTLHEGHRLLIHPAMVVLADSARARALSPDARQRLLAAVFSKAFLARAAWNDVETEYLLSTAIALLEPKDRRDVALARGLLADLKRLCRGELGQIPLRFRTCLRLWRQLSQKTPGADRSEVTFILQVLPAMKKSANLSIAFNRLQDALENGEGPDKDGGAGREPGELDDRELARLLLVILDGIRGKDETVYRMSHKALRDLSRQITLQPGQLRPVVECLVQATKLSWNRPKQRGEWKKLQSELERWARLVPHKREPTVFDATTWSRWLADDQRVLAREKELLAPTKLNEITSARHLVYYEFDLALDNVSSGEVLTGEKPFQVLDGRRLVVLPSKPVFYEDRWGNPLVLKLTAQTNTKRGGPARFRASSVNKHLFTGRLELTNVGGKEFSRTRYETSDGFLGSRPFGRNRGSYRTLTLLQFPDEDPSPPPTGEGAGILWQWFIENHLLNLPAKPTQDQVKNRLGILKTLRVGEWCAPFLRKLLKMRRLLRTQQTVRIAKDLHRFGDKVGFEFLQGELLSIDLDRRLAAACGLCELGLRAGVEAIIEHFDGKTNSNKIINALNVYLQKKGADAEGRKQVLDFLTSHLTHRGFQRRAFKVLQRESGLDFGYEAARSRRDPKERAREIQRAVRESRAWWREQKARSK